MRIPLDGDAGQMGEPANQFLVERSGAARGVLVERERTERPAVAGHNRRRPAGAEAGGRGQTGPLAIPPPRVPRDVGDDELFLIAVRQRRTGPSTTRPSCHRWLE